MTTVRLFKLGNSQAVRIPARYRMAAEEVEIFEQDGDLILRPRARTADDFFARIRAMPGDLSDLQRPPQGETPPAPAFDD